MELFKEARIRVQRSLLLFVCHKKVEVDSRVPPPVDFAGEDAPRDGVRPHLEHSKAGELREGEEVKGEAQLRAHGISPLQHSPHVGLGLQPPVNLGVDELAEPVLQEAQVIRCSLRKSVCGVIFSRW